MKCEVGEFEGLKSNQIKSGKEKLLLLPFGHGGDNKRSHRWCWCLNSNDPDASEALYEIIRYEIPLN